MSESFVKMARMYQADPAIVQERAANAGPYGRSREELDALAPELRPELYALCAIVANDVVDEAQRNAANFPPYGLCAEDREQPVTAIAEFDGLRRVFNSTLDRSFLDVMSRYTRESNPILDRLARLCTVFAATEGVARYSSVTALMMAGIGTASKETQVALQTIHRVTRRYNAEATPEMVADIARKSGSIINRIAGVNLGHLQGAAHILALAGADPNQQALQLKTKSDGSQHLDFTQPLLYFKHPTGGSHQELIGDTPVKYHTLGCPARASFNGSSAINRIWQWAVNVAEQAGLFESARADEVEVAFIQPSKWPNR